jgi:hypothetical protein
MDDFEKARCREFCGAVEACYYWIKDRAEEPTIRAKVVSVPGSSIDLSLSAACEMVWNISNPMPEKTYSLLRNMMRIPFQGHRSQFRNNYAEGARCLLDLIEYEREDRRRLDEPNP